MKTFVAVKPDGIRRGLIGEVIKRLEKRNLSIIGLKMLWMDRSMAKDHYSAHKDKEFFEDLIKYITSSPVVAMVVEGENAVSVVRNMVGETDPKEAAPGTIRGDFALDISKNIVHAADSEESARKEISLFFEDDELYNH